MEYINIDERGWQAVPISCLEWGTMYTATLATPFTSLSELPPHFLGNSVGRMILTSFFIYSHNKAKVFEFLHLIKYKTVCKIQNSEELRTTASSITICTVFASWELERKIFPCQGKVRGDSSLACITYLFQSHKPNHCYRFPHSHSQGFLVWEISSHGKQWLYSHMGSCLTHTVGICFMKQGRDARVTLRLGCPPVSSSRRS